MSSRKQAIGLVVFIVLCLAVAGQGGLVTSPNITRWYATLAKPSWTPPYWVFGPVWTMLYLSMAIAAWLVWRQGGLRRAAVPMILFAIQLVLNAAWSWLFFGLHNPGWALVDLLLLWLAIAATIATFWRQSLVAGLLLVPYLAWVTFAGALNYTIWQMNA